MWYDWYFIEWGLFVFVVEDDDDDDDGDEDDDDEDGDEDELDDEDDDEVGLSYLEKENLDVSLKIHILKLTIIELDLLTKGIMN